MFCPNCGNDCKNADCCDICGQILSGIELTNTEAVSEPPVGVYEGLDGTLEISLVSLTIRKQLLSQQTEHLVLFDDIAQVKFQTAPSAGIGFLAIRNINVSKPLAETLEDATGSETALLISEDMNEEFEAIYRFLDITARKNDLVDKDGKILRSGLRKRTGAKWENVFCPCCNSWNLVVHELSSRPRNTIYGTGWTQLAGIALDLVYFIGTNRVTFECRECGHKWVRTKLKIK